MSSPRCIAILTLTAALGPLLPADEVQKLPPLTVNAPAGPLSALTSLLPIAEAELDTDPATLARTTPGLSLNDAGAHGFGTTTSLRGLANTPFFGDASAPVYLDGIPLGSSFTFPSALAGFASVTVHRGPQAATLFGHAGDAGVIEISSARPGSDSAGHLRMSAGNHGQFAAVISADAAATASADLSASLVASRRDGYIRNTTLNRTVDDREALAGRVGFNFRAAEDTTISLRLIGSRDRDGAQALVPLGGPYHEVARGREGESDIDFAAVAVGVNRKLAGGTLTSTTSWSDWKLSPYSNRLVVFGGFDFDSVLSLTQRTFAEEIRFAGAQWSGGVFLSSVRTAGATERVFSGFPLEGSSYTTDADSAALFTRGNVATAAGWVLTPGLRLERTVKEFARTETIPAASLIRRDNSWAALLPSLATSRRFGQTGELTLTMARGFKPGGYSAYTGRADLAEFGAQRNWSVEAAWSSSLRAARLGYTARAYASRVTGYQIERSFAVPGSFTDEYLVVNAGEARVLGLELESGWQPAPDWRVTLAASVCHAELRDFTDPFTGDNHSGNRAPYAPTGNGALRVEYRPARGFFAGAGITWTGTTYYDEQGTALFSQRSYALIEAQAGYAFARGEVRLTGRNLGDKEYYSAITPGVGHATPGAPLTWGGEVTLHW